MKILKVDRWALSLTFLTIDTYYCCNIQIWDESCDFKLLIFLLRFSLSSLRPSDAYICVSKLTIIGSDNGLSPRRRQAIIWTNAEIFLIGPLGTKLSEILIEIVWVSFKKMRLKGSSAKWRPFCLGLNCLTENQWMLIQISLNFVS